MNPIQQITDSLKVILAPMDAEVLEASMVWAKGRVAALKEFKASEEYKVLNAKGAWGGVYDKLFALAGGKTWYNIFNGHSSVMIDEFVKKNCEAIAQKRNASITAKLVKAGVSEVLSQTYTHTNDGFDGTFIVNTNKGRKVVTINTIRAGGYNIQCLHLRVLVRVK